MSKNVTVHSRSGIGGSTALTILFVLLKVFGKIDWSWWWVFAPIWIGAAFVLLILAGALILALIAALIAALIE